jgi:hypothetical protein
MRARVATAIAAAWLVVGCADLLGVEPLSGAVDASVAPDAGADAPAIDTGGPAPVDGGARDAPTNDVGDAGSDACTLTWIASSSGVVPPGAVPANPSPDATVKIYVCRASSDAGLIPGKLLPAWGCYTADAVQFHATDYEVLVPSGCSLDWSPPLNGIAPVGAVVCGNDSQGVLYSCRTSDAAADQGEIGHMGWSTAHQCAYTLSGNLLQTDAYDVLAQPGP